MARICPKFFGKKHLFSINFKLFAYYFFMRDYKEAVNKLNEMLDNFEEDIDENMKFSFSNLETEDPIKKIQTQKMFYRN